MGKYTRLMIDFKNGKSTNLIVDGFYKDIETIVLERFLTGDFVSLKGSEEPSKLRTGKSTPFTVTLMKDSINYIVIADYKLEADSDTVEQEDVGEE